MFWAPSLGSWVLRSCGIVAASFLVRRAGGPNSPSRLIDGRRAAGAFLALMLSAGGILYRYYAVYPFVRDARFLTRSLSYRYLNSPVPTWARQSQEAYQWYHIGYSTVVGDLKHTTRHGTIRTVAARCGGSGSERGRGDLQRARPPSRHKIPAASYTSIHY